MIADKNLVEWTRSLLELAILCRHLNRYLWMLEQLYSAIQKNLRRKINAIFICHTKEKANLKTIHNEKSLVADDEWMIIRGLLKQSKPACLYIQNEHPHRFKTLIHS